MPLAPAALEPLLRLAVVDGIGAVRLASLIRRFGSAERVLAASAVELAALPKIGPELVKRIAAAGGPEGKERARAALEAMRRVGAVALTPDDLAYPEAFRALPDAPFLLFASGNLALMGTPGVGVVGTRSPTDYGRSATAALAGDLSRAGYTIVSGMAKGIDAAAHAAALEAGGGTIGVLGQGIDRVYPAENRLLFGAVRERGLLISELAPGEDPAAGNFPRRNRLIAALSLGVLVVEMAEKSGAQHTVTYALELGREVFAVPGPIGSAMSAGTNQLLKDGARLVTSARDVIEELRGVGAQELSLFGQAGSSAPTPASASAASLASAGTAAATAFGTAGSAGSGSAASSASIASADTAPRPAPKDLAPDEAKVLSSLRGEPRHVDELAAETGLAPSNVLAALLGLELRELAGSLPGKQYVRR